MDVKEKDENLITSENTENKENTSIIVTSTDNDFVEVKRPIIGKKEIFSILKMLIIICIIVFVVLFLILTFYNMVNTNIISGVSIKGIDVSNMSKSDAKYQLDNYIAESLPEEIKLKHGDFETTMSLSQIGTSFDTKSATNSAYHIGRQDNIFKNNLYILSTMFGKVNIEPKLSFDKKQLTKNLDDISTQLPDTVIQSSYYI